MNANAWTPPTQAQLQAANQITQVIINALQSERGAHAETAVSTAAHLAGTCLFRSFNFPAKGIKPGAPVFSDAANDQGPLLMQTLSAGLSAYKVALDKSKLGANIPESHQPHLKTLEMQQLVEAKILAIARKNNLTYPQTAHACAIATARLIQMCSTVLDHHIGFALAVQGFVEGSKTMPMPLSQADSL